jgi:hypothetical protein
VNYIYDRYIILEDVKSERHIVEATCIEMSLTSLSPTLSNPNPRPNKYIGNCERKELAIKNLFPPSPADQKKRE